MSSGNSSGGSSSSKGGRMSFNVPYSNPPNSTVNSSKDVVQRPQKKTKSSSPESSGGGGGSGHIQSPPSLASPTKGGSIRNSSGGSSGGSGTPNNIGLVSQTFDLRNSNDRTRDEEMNDDHQEEDNINFDDDDKVDQEVIKKQPSPPSPPPHPPPRPQPPQTKHVHTQQQQQKNTNNNNNNNNNSNQKNDKKPDRDNDGSESESEEEEVEKSSSEIEESNDEEEEEEEVEHSSSEIEESNDEDEKEREREKEMEKKKRQMYIQQQQQQQKKPKDINEPMIQDSNYDEEEELSKVTDNLSSRKKKTIIQEDEEEIEDQEMGEQDEEHEDQHQKRSTWDLKPQTFEPIPKYQTLIEQQQQQSQFMPMASQYSQIGVPFDSFESEHDHFQLNLIPLNPKMLNLPSQTHFFELLSSLSVQFNPDHQRLFIKDTSLFKRELQKYYKDRKRVEIFQKELGCMINQQEVLFMILSPVVGESKSVTQESMVKLLLSIPALQQDMITMLLGEYLVGLQPDLVKLLISQFRWLELAGGDSCMISSRVLDLFDMMSDQVELKKDLIGFLPELCEDSGHAMAVEHLLQLMSTDSTYTVVVIDALGAFNLTDTTRKKARDAMFIQLSCCVTSELPVVLNALLQSINPSEVTETIKKLRENISFPSTARLISSSTGSPAGLYNQSNMLDRKILEQNSDEMVVLDTLKTNFRFKKDLCTAFIREISSNSKTFNVFDFWLLLVIYSFWSQPKDIESLLKKKIMSGSLTKATLLSSLQSHNISLKPYFKILLILSDSFLRSAEPKVRLIGHHFYYILFQVFHDERDTVLSSLLLHIGSGNIGEVDEALSVLLELSTNCGEILKRHNNFIKRIMDQHEMLLEHQIRKVFRLMATQSFNIQLDGDSYRVENNKDMNELDMYTRKLSSGSSLKYKKFGIISGCAQIQVLAKRVCIKDRDKGEKLIDVPAEVSDRAMYLFNSLSESCKKSKPFDKLLTAYLFDEMQQIFTNQFCPKFIDHIAGLFIDMEEFNNLFNNHIGRIDGVWFKKDDSTMAVDIYPKICNPAQKDNVLVSAPLFRFLRTFVRASKNSLEDLSGVLEVPLVMFDEELLEFDMVKGKDSYALAIYYAVDWIRETINAFSPQMDLYHNGVSQRLKDLIVVEERLNHVLSLCPSFNAPYGSFNSDLRKNLSVDLKKIKKKKLSWLNDEDCDHYLPHLDAIGIHLRKLDLNSLLILQSNVKNSHDGTFNIIELDAPQLHYLLVDFNRKITSLLSSEKRNPFGHGSSQRYILDYSFIEMIKTLMAIFPALCVHLERTVQTIEQLFPDQEEMFKQFKVAQSKSKHNPENQEYKLAMEKMDDVFTKSQKIYSLNLANTHLIFEIFTKILSYDSFDFQDLQEIMASVHEKRTTKLNLTAIDLSFKLFNYFEKFWVSLLQVKAFRPCTSLLTLLTTLYNNDKKSSKGNTNRNGVDPKVQIFNYAKQAIGQSWGRKIPATSTSYLLKTLFSHAENQKEVGIIILCEFFVVVCATNNLNALEKAKSKSKSKAKGKAKGKGKSKAKGKSKGKGKGKGKSTHDSDDDEEEQEEEEEEEENEDSSEQDDHQESQMDDDKLGEESIKMMTNTVFNLVDPERISLRIFNPSSNMVYFRTLFTLINEQMALVDINSQRPKDILIQCQHLVAMCDMLLEFSKEIHYVADSLKHGKNFVMEFTKHFVPIIDKLFEFSISKTKDIIKKFQDVTGALQHLCTQVKNTKDQSGVSLVPLAKKAISTFASEIMVKFRKHKWQNNVSFQLLKTKNAPTRGGGGRGSGSGSDDDDDDDDDDDEQYSNDDEDQDQDQDNSESSNYDGSSSSEYDEAEEVSQVEDSEQEEEPSGDDLDDLIDD
ncbi:hypothetical protein DFA_04403 [Cavenderia fasciculata]|uniref:Fanconi anemia group D2 protein n=1 Tax=Cavenderia fasciculata TaxID=261658 RepID=F4PPH2_CACFS|nr:uncharacterized protein DFA_04403 [Cavenderia fasciculata]EGG22285.1 hypothetical protein DFA_04403 [Cavenderia fasciculata]|eukprot:XP_004360136.1 hypothetical protein DFA_04403 [Cavenderia fasciculata]